VPISLSPPPLDNDDDKSDGDRSSPSSLPSANDAALGKGASGATSNGGNDDDNNDDQCGAGNLATAVANALALTLGASSKQSLPTSDRGSAVVVVWTVKIWVQREQQRCGIR